MTSLFSAYLDTAGIVILDGALATELESWGADLNHSLWSAKLLTENPALIKQVHKDYIQAGANVITSASYQASFDGFANYGLTHEQAADLMRLSVQLAVEARDETASAMPRPLVAASVGPYGASLADGSEYRGNYGVSIETLMDFHRPRLAVLADSGADLLACETIPCLDEGIALIRLLAEFPNTRAWISFSANDEKRVCSGDNFADCAQLANLSEQVVAIGINCTPPVFVESLVSIASQVTDKPILAYPNRGEQYDAIQKCWLPGTQAHISFLDYAKRWYEAGARLIGGCCRTTPNDIRQLVSTLSGR